MTRDEELAADLTQDALLRAWRKRRSLKDHRARRAWVFRIAANLYRDHCRKACHFSSWEAALEPPCDTTPSPERVATDRELQDLVAMALDKLPERQRQVMHLRMIEQLAPSQIARILGIDAAAVRSSLAAARKRLRSHLADVVQDHRHHENLKGKGNAETRLKQ